MKINQISVNNLYFGISKRKKRQKELEAMKIKRTSRQNPKEADGVQIIEMENGTVFKIFPDGHKEEYRTDNSIRFYDSNGKFYKMVITKEDGHIKTYNRACKIVKEEFPDKSYTSFDKNGKKIKDVYINGFIRFYDKDNKVLYMHFPDGHERWGNGEIKQKTDENGIIKNYDEDGNLTHIISP